MENPDKFIFLKTEYQLTSENDLSIVPFIKKKR